MSITKYAKEFYKQIKEKQQKPNKIIVIETK